MSRGPGALQIQVMHTLKAYRDLGAALGWRWCVGGSWQRKYADPHDIREYERGGYVELWKLQRDLSVATPLLSRGLRGLDRMGYVSLRDAALAYPGDKFSYGCNTKFAGLSREGKDWLSDNKSKVIKLSLKGATA